MVISILVRHVPQVCADWRNRKRSTLLKAKVAIKAYHIATLWFLLILAAVFSALEGLGLHSWIGLAIMILGQISGLVALYQLGTSYSEELVIFRDSYLIRKGLYSLVRHPLRLTLSIETFGAVVVSGKLVFLVPWMLIVIAQAHRSSVEDRLLREHYGTPALQYQQSVPAFNIFSNLRFLFNSKIARN